MTWDKLPCTFPIMAVKMSKIRQRKATPGADGRTLGERLHEAMARARPALTESALISSCKRIAGGTDVVSQQLVNQILNGKNSRSAAVPILAEACGVRAVWLQFGFGPMRDESPNGRGVMSHRDRADRAFMQAFRELPKEWEYTIRSVVETLAVAMRESHGEFASQARAKTAELLAANHKTRDDATEGS